MADTEWWRALGRTASPSVTFGRNVAQRRSLYGWNQASLARRLQALGISARQNTVSRIESATRPVTIDELAALGFVFAERARSDAAEAASRGGPRVTWDDADVINELMADPVEVSKSVAAQRERALRFYRERLEQLHRQRDECEAEIAKTVAGLQAWEPAK